MNGKKNQRMISVLHVDKEPNFLAVSKIFLEKAGFRVDTAHSAEKGIELLKGGNYDVVLLEYNMQGMDGLEFFQTLRAYENKILFIMFTGRGREEVAIDALNEGAIHYLQKRGDIKSMYGTLVQVIKDEVEKKRATDKLAAVEKE